MYILSVYWAVTLAGRNRKLLYCMAVVHCIRPIGRQASGLGSADPIQKLNFLLNYKLVEA